MVFTLHWLVAFVPHCLLLVLLRFFNGPFSLSRHIFLWILSITFWLLEHCVSCMCSVCKSVCVCDTFSNDEIFRFDGIQYSLIYGHSVPLWARLFFILRLLKCSFARYCSCSTPMGTHTAQKMARSPCSKTYFSQLGSRSTQWILD